MSTKLTLGYALLPAPLAILALAFVRAWSPLPRAALAGAVSGLAWALFASRLQKKGAWVALAALLGFVGAAGASLVSDLLLT